MSDITPNEIVNQLQKAARLFKMFEKASEYASKFEQMERDKVGLEEAIKLLEGQKDNLLAAVQKENGVLSFIKQEQAKVKQQSVDMNQKASDESKSIIAEAKKEAKDILDSAKEEEKELKSKVNTVKKVLADLETQRIKAEDKVKLIEKQAEDLKNTFLNSLSKDQ